MVGLCTKGSFRQLDHGPQVGQGLRFQVLALEQAQLVRVNYTTLLALAPFHVLFICFRANWHLYATISGILFHMTISLHVMISNSL
jgi:hypothetical protein